MDQDALPSQTSAVRRILHWIPAMLAVTMIALESTPEMGASNTSRWLLPLWTHLFGPVTPARWEVIHHYIRKTGHFTGYGVVSLCFFYGWRTSLSLARRGLSAVRGWASVYAVLCTLAIASADEFHQSFLPNRTASVFDVGIDVCGGIFAQLVLQAAIRAITRSRAVKIVAA
jgi:VanZ family protein